MLREGILEQEEKVELRQYWNIVYRRLWMVVALTLLSLVAALLFRPTYTPQYQSTLRLSIKPEVQSPDDRYYYPEYWGYLASEYLVDDLSAVMESPSFMADVRERLKGRPAGPPQGTITTKKSHRVLKVTVTSDSAENAQLLANTIGQMLTEPRARYLREISDQNVTVTIVDPPTVIPLAVRRDFLDIALRVLLGLFAGVGLAFLLDYLDNTIRDSDDIRRFVGLAVIGEIPAERYRRWGRWPLRSTDTGGRKRIVLHSSDPSAMGWRGDDV
ncbi:MAG: Wzz/FepE/Etk N-terminal domain-containing protein [Chloroflexi bacterium]|nr:Wzz/FepE/Etk N-terminal domain-containing protein [Chloroflexota bacterium]